MGPLCFVSNNSFVDQIAFDGMRKHLLQDFTQIYHLDLHGNIRKNPKISGTTHNVFGIQLGVGITIAVRASQQPTRKLYYYRVPEFWKKTEKLAFLNSKKNISGVEWEILEPDERYTWHTKGMHSEFAAFLPMGAKEAKAGLDIQAHTIFKRYSLGVATNRDEWVYDFKLLGLTEKMHHFIRNYNSEVFRWSQEGLAISQIDDFVNNDPTFLKWTDRLKEAVQKNHLLKFEEDKIRLSLYRPFCRQILYFDHLLNQRRYQQHFFYPTFETENIEIIVGGYGRKHFAVLVSNYIPDLNFYADPAQCFPYYTYAQDGSNRRENITDWSLTRFQVMYGNEVTKWDIFHYVYAILHHPQYRERYADNLKRELPRIPLFKDAATFEMCVRIGKQLMTIHLNYEQVSEYPLKWIENKEVSVNWHIKKMRLSPSKETLVVNEWLTLSGIPPECFQYRLGNRSTLEWVIDQYWINSHARSGIINDPNNDDDPEYIVRLVGRVITVSMETVKLVNELAAAVTQDDWKSEIAIDSADHSLVQSIE